MTGGFPIVLTADRSLMAGYKLLFDGMLACSQTTTTPGIMMQSLLMAAAASSNGHATVAPLGLRRIEAALIKGGITPEQIIVVDEQHLSQVIGPDTRVVAISTGEPCGLGMNSSTMVAVAGGRIYPEVEFHRLLTRVHKCISLHKAVAKVVIGGPGAWQLAGNDELRQLLGIDHVVTGYAEENITELFQNLLNAVKAPAIFAGVSASVTDIPRVVSPSTMGVVEISRGCGLGCRFCALAGEVMRHLPEETILADIHTNLAGGNPNIALLSEDFFRYGADGLRVQPEALIGLLTRVRQLPGIRLVQVDHVNIASVAQYSDNELRAVRQLLVGDTGVEYPWVNVGVESASGSLLQSCASVAKMGHVSPDSWGDFCAEQLLRLCKAGFFPMVSLMIGIPGETIEDIRKTQAWITALGNEIIAIFPVLYAPMDGSQRIGRSALHREHWQLIRSCYNLNFRWIPKMYWDNQRGAGVPLFRRFLLQMLGYAQVVEWLMFFSWHSWRAKNG